MILEVPKDFKDFELLDTGQGFRLERWGEVILARPDPQIIWQKSLPRQDWDKAWAVYKPGSEEDKGRWQIAKPLPNPWVISYTYLANKPASLASSPRSAVDAGQSGTAGQSVDTKFLLKLSPFKHTGIFAEQAAQWKWMLNKLSSLSSHKVIKSEQNLGFKNSRLDNFQMANKFKVLNLFAYTGGATMVLAKLGCQVTHVDASKPAITWANENHKLNNLAAGSVRWILDDCVKFVKRELKRGVKYQGIVMDPPAFGHAPSGKTWKFNNDLPGLLADCVKLLSDDAKFLIINGYATNSSAVALNNLLEDNLASKTGKVEFGELCLKQKNSRMISTGIFARWSKI